MIYIETLRHYAQEWIKVTPPADPEREWLWDKNYELYLINLYPVAGPEFFTPDKPPVPLVSVLVSTREPMKAMLPSKFTLNAPYFRRSMYSLPRRFVNTLRNDDGQMDSHTYLRRGSFTANKVGYVVGDPYSSDSRLIRMLASNGHLRYCLYGSHEYALIRERLNEMADEAGIPINCAEDLMDTTAYAVKHRNQQAPDMYLIAVPVVGFVKPIHRSKEYRIINGAYVVAQDEIRLSIEEEPCHGYYDRVRVPFAHLQHKTKDLQATAVPNKARGIVYLAVEVPCGSFTIQEFRPTDVLKCAGRDYVRVIDHHFHLAPELYDSLNTVNTTLVARLSHTIEEGVIPKTLQNKRFLGPFNHKMFHRTNLPVGYVMRSDGTVETKLDVGTHDT